MPRDYRKLLKEAARPCLRWVPAAVLIGATLALSLQLLEPRGEVVQTVSMGEGKWIVRLEKRRYVRRDDWVVRVRKGRIWRTVFYWSPPDDGRRDPGEVPRLAPQDNTNAVALVVGGRVVWRYDAERGSGK